MKDNDIPLLGCALLGLIFQNPCSGYDLCKLFTHSPMGSFSDSPGAIYPALRGLERGALIRGRVEDGNGLRRKKVFHLTPEGTAAFKRWLKRPVSRLEVVRHLDSLMLRFSFMEQAIGEAGARRFLHAFREELQSYIPSLHQYFTLHRSEMSRSGALALESGIRGYETLLAWCEHAIAIYENKEGRPS